MSFVLLTLPNVSLSTATTYESGTLSLECLSESDATPANLDSSVTLALHLNSHTFKLEPASPVSLVISPNGERTYAFEPASSEKANFDSDKKSSTVKLTVHPPTVEGQHVAEDIETLDHLLMQYADLSWSYDIPNPSLGVPPPLPARPVSSVPAHHQNIQSNVETAKPVDDPGLRGCLVLMDESSGDVVGELPQSLHITEDPALVGKETGPVVLELHPDMYDACTGVKELGAEGTELQEAKEVFARAVPPEEQDWMMKSATLVSQAISGSTSLLLSGMTSASNYYISHTSSGTPTPAASGSPSPAAQQSPSASTSTLARAYNLSGQAARASSRTADAVEGLIRRAVGGKDKATPPPRATFNPGPPSEISHSTPPAYAVYLPKHKPQLSQTSAEKDRKDVRVSPDENSDKPLRTLDKVLLSANLVLSTVDDSARRVFEVGSERLGAVVGHKYGTDAQHSTHLATHTARNVVLVYVDVRGFARRALLKKTGKEFVKARFGGKDKGTSQAAAKT